MRFKSIQEVLDKVKSSPCGHRLAVVGAEDAHILEAVFRAYDEGIIYPVLIGDGNGIQDALKKLGRSASGVDIEAVDSIEAAAAKGAELVKEGKARIIMKGLAQTSTFMRPIVSKENGLSQSGVISLFGLTEIPGHDRLISMTDCGIVLQPKLEQKKWIINNAVRTLTDMGYDTPKVAVICATEDVNPKMQETVDAVELVKMNENGEIPDCIVEGPISMDIALDRVSARRKGYTGVVSGDADIFLMPNVLTGNVAGKLLAHFAHTTGITFGVGAKAPIVLTSRGAESDTKYRSILACAAAVPKES